MEFPFSCACLALVIALYTKFSCADEGEANTKSGRGVAVGLIKLVKVTMGLHAVGAAGAPHHITTSDCSSMILLEHQYKLLCLIGNTLLTIQTKVTGIAPKPLLLGLEGAELRF